MIITIASLSVSGESPLTRIRGVAVEAFLFPTMPLLAI